VPDRHTSLSPTVYPGNPFEGDGVHHCNEPAQLHVRQVKRLLAARAHLRVRLLLN